MHGHWWKCGGIPGLRGKPDGQVRRSTQLRKQIVCCHTLDCCKWSPDLTIGAGRQSCSLELTTLRDSTHKNTTKLVWRIRTATWAKLHDEGGGSTKGSSSAATLALDTPRRAVPNRVAAESTSPPSALYLSESSTPEVYAAAASCGRATPMGPIFAQLHVNGSQSIPCSPLRAFI